MGEEVRGSPLLVPLIKQVTFTALSPRTRIEEGSTLPTPPPPLLLSLLLKKLSLSKVQLLLSSTTSREVKPKSVLSLSPSHSELFLMVKPTTGCVRLPLSTHLTQLSEPQWPKVVRPLLNQYTGLVVA